MTMICNEKNGLKYYTFRSFENEGIKHGFFTRQGGISPKPFESLNMATTGGDSAANVLENLRRMFSVFDLNLYSRYDGWQVHGDTIICTDKPRNLNSRSLKADGLISNNVNVTLVMRFGDCVPVLLFDKVTKTIGIYHAGWPGTIKKIGARMVEKMQLLYGTDPGNIIAGIGPSIGPDHFEVKSDVLIPFEKKFSEWKNEIIQMKEEKYYIDLWKTNRLILESVGVKQIEVAEICTYCHSDEWFSNRAEKGNTGRFGVLISL